MRVHVIKHVPFEGPGSIAEWASKRGHELTESLSLTSEFPPLEEVDLLVVMGGPMAADDHTRNPWLVAEKDYVKRAIAANKLVVGICLGAQILAEVIGGAIRRNDYLEIGWFELRHTTHASSDPLFASFPESFVAGHWHGDTFDLPPHLHSALASDATANQAFSYNSGRVAGLQFHLEWTPADLELLVEESAEDLDATGPYLMTAAQMLEGIGHYGDDNRTLMAELLDSMVSLAE